MGSSRVINQGLPTEDRLSSTMELEPFELIFMFRTVTTTMCMQSFVFAPRIDGYVRVIGSPREFQGRVTISGYHIDPIFDLNEVTCHYLDCIQCYLHYSKRSVGVNSRAYQRPPCPQRQRIARAQITWIWNLGYFLIDRHSIDPEVRP